MHKVLVSACLLGVPVRHHGGSARLDHPVLQRWADEGRLVPICPEVAGGLPTPRPPAEISPAAGGPRAGEAVVVTADGRDVSEPYRRGADAAVHAARSLGVRLAILKDGSPSCGSWMIHDGTFTGTRVAGEGLTAARLRAEGVRVFNETQLEDAAAWLSELERGDAMDGRGQWGGG